MKEIIFFSNNQNKILEILNLFKSTQFKILNLYNLKKIKSPIEIGESFEANAKIKASYGYNIFKKPCFSDDSGICIEAIQNNPGINSKNFLENNKGLNSAFNKILPTLERKNNYKAFFQTSISLTLNGKDFIFFNGIIKGRISKKIKGNGGFGYDPIFIPKNCSKTFAEMSLKRKNLFSHRAIAIQKLKTYVMNLI